MRAVPSSFVDNRTKEWVRFSERDVDAPVSGDAVGCEGALGKVMTSDA